MMPFLNLPQIFQTLCVANTALENSSEQDPEPGPGCCADQCRHQRVLWDQGWPRIAGGMRNSALACPYLHTSRDQHSWQSEGYDRTAGICSHSSKTAGSRLEYPFYQPGGCIAACEHSSSAEPAAHGTPGMGFGITRTVFPHSISRENQPDKPLV